MNLLQKLLIPVAAIAIASSASATVFNLTGSDSTTGTNGNTHSFGPLDGITLVTSGWSTSDSGTTFTAGYTGRYGSGSGVTNAFESGSSHRIDNGVSKDYLLFNFGQEVTISQVVLGSISGDSDMEIMAGNTLAGLYASFTTHNSSVSSGSRTQAVSGTGQYVLIGAKRSSSNDAFKIKSVTVTKTSSPISTPDSGATAALLGLGLLGLAAARKRLVK